MRDSRDSKGCIDHYEPRDAAQAKSIAYSFYSYWFSFYTCHGITVMRYDVCVTSTPQYYLYTGKSVYEILAVRYTGTAAAIPAALSGFSVRSGEKCRKQWKELLDLCI